MSTSAFYGKGDPAFAPHGYADHADRKRHRDDAFAYRALFVVSFALFLPALALRRALPGARTGLVRRSLIEETRVAASTVSACAFMG